MTLSMRQQFTRPRLTIAVALLGAATLGLNTPAHADIGGTKR